MATSGSFNTSAYDGYYLKFSWEQTSQSVASNTTTISWKLTGVGKYNNAFYYTQNIKVIIDGDTVFYKPKSAGQVELWNGTVVASGSKTIAHNSDGTRSFSAYAEAGIYNWAVNCTGEGSWTLSTIARASQPSLVTWPETTANVGNFGETFSIHMNRNSSSFTHTVRYEYGSRKGTIATGVTTGTTWAVPLDFMNDIPNATSASGRIYVDTYNGSTLIGTKYTGFTVTVPSSVKPTCTFTLEDITGVDDVYGSPVKGLSKIKVTVTATKAYSSPIASYVIEANGVRYTAAEATTGILVTAGTSPVKATVTDKRGRSGSVSYNMSVQDYTAPSVTALSVRRCNSDGTANEQGGYIKITFSARVSSMNSKNTATYKLRYKKSTETSYSSVTLSALVNNYSVSNHEHILSADTGSSYDVEVTATDRHKSDARSTSASTAFSLMHWNAAGNGVAFGKLSEKENTAEFAIDVEFSGKVTGTIFDAIYPVGSIYLAYNHTNPGTLFPGTTWARIYGAFPWFTDGNGQIGLTGGERTVTLTASQIPSHNHGGTYTNAGTARTHAWLASGGSAMGYDTVNAGGGEAHNNMPPYIQISAWRRTA